MADAEQQIIKAGEKFTQAIAGVQTSAEHFTGLCLQVDCALKSFTPEAIASGLAVPLVLTHLKEIRHALDAISAHCSAASAACLEFDQVLQAAIHSPQEPS